METEMFFVDTGRPDQEAVEKPQKVKGQQEIVVVNKERPFGKFRPKGKFQNKKFDQKFNPNQGRVFRRRGGKKFQGPAPIDKEALEKHSRGTGADATGVKGNFHRAKLRKKEIYHEFATEQAARTEILLTEGEGFIEPDEGEETAEYTQGEIRENVDITAATKAFELKLDFGAYRMRYTRNGRHLLLGGRKGHVAALDWVRKKLHCETNVMEEVVDVSWLHLETMYAAAQKQWVHFYDKKGVELHCVKRLHRVERMEFLPYHFLLATVSDTGYLSWLDVSVGEIVGNFHAKVGRIRSVCQNPYNALLCLGGAKGVVSMWAPSQPQAVAQMVCHPAPLSAIATDSTGLNLFTAGQDRCVRVWDLRQLSGPLHIYRTRTAVQELAISQRGLMGFAMGNVVEIYRKPSALTAVTPYLRQRVEGHVTGLQFCPYEDVLGVSTARGFTSLLVPGAGEPNFDAREANPFMSLSQRREHEVHALLEKIPMELIALEPNKVAEVDVPTFKERFEAKRKMMLMKPPKIDFEPRRKAKGKGGSVQRAKNKQIEREKKRKEFKEDVRELQRKIVEEHKEKDVVAPAEDFIPLESKSKSVLDRFRPKKKQKK
ncbi:WD repeat-containing protein 46 [Lutzomyia longipalpis]|uniref:WD repeat-containing protein 46 n=1 Tax=Lutzomyia longipalpis TaxID=7200 RepID=UPI002483CBC2|nr:WD repeat-containing protein 46 [Lutzomyia longipalpis]